MAVIMPLSSSQVTLDVSVVTKSKGSDGDGIITLDVEEQNGLAVSVISTV